MTSLVSRSFWLIGIVCLLVACKGKIQPPPLYTFSDYEAVATDVVEVPFKEYGGVRTIQVKINDYCTEFPMIFDTGCSGVAMSVLELNTLFKRGYISSDDVIGMTTAQIADGSIVENMVVNLRIVSIITDDGSSIDCHNVKATVYNNINAPLLLGNEVLDEVAYDYTVDNTNKVIHFNVK
jgi:hypothetical protein